MLVGYDNSREYELGQSGDLFWHIFYYAQLNILYIYPDFFHWLQKVIREMPIGNRIIFASYKNPDKMTGYMVLKRDKTEHKICTLQVFPEYRKQGYASEMLRAALEVLKEPILTVSDFQMERYSGILSQYNFSLIKEVPGMYNKDSTEYIFKRKDV